MNERMRGKETKPNIVAYDFRRKMSKIFTNQPQYQCLFSLHELWTVKLLPALRKG